MATGTEEKGIRSRSRVLRGKTPSAFEVKGIMFSRLKALLKRIANFLNGSETERPVNPDEARANAMEDPNRTWRELLRSLRNPDDHDSVKSR